MEPLHDKTIYHCGGLQKTCKMTPYESVISAVRRTQPNNIGPNLLPRPRSLVNNNNTSHLPMLRTLNLRTSDDCYWIPCQSKNRNRKQNREFLRGSARKKNLHTDLIRVWIIKGLKLLYIMNGYILSIGPLATSVSDPGKNITDPDPDPT